MTPNVNDGDVDIGYAGGDFNDDGVGGGCEDKILSLALPFE